MTSKHWRRRIARLRRIYFRTTDERIRDKVAGMFWDQFEMLRNQAIERAMGV